MNTSRIWRIGLTGGIGSGKSTVAAMLARLGAHTVDADAISRSTTASGGAAIAAIAATFGARLIAPDGALDRTAMRELVFSSPTAKVQLEAIVHPLVSAEIARQVQVAETTGATCIVFDIPLLVESAHWRKSLHRVLVVDCTEATQRARVAGRSGLADAEIQRIIQAQASRTRRLAAADLVLFNDGLTLAQLGEQVQQIGMQFGL